MPIYRYVCQECEENQVYSTLLPPGADCEFCQHPYFSHSNIIPDEDPIAFSGRHGRGSNLGMIIDGKIVN